MIALLLTSALAAPVHVVVGTKAPLSIGGKARIELPGRVQLGAGVGYLPGGYVDVINGTAMLFNAYEQSTADLIKAAIQSSAVIDADVAWRPKASSGFNFGLGYSLVALGGDATTAELITGVTGIEAPDSSGDANGPLGDRGGSVDDQSYDITATVHLVRPEVGWQIGLGERWMVDVGFGGAFTVGSRVTVAAQNESAVPALQDAFETGTADWLEDTLEQYVHSPTISVGFGAKFGGP
jgi:hypothetical protein